MSDEAIVTSPAGDLASAQIAPAAPAIDAEAIKAQLRQEMLAEFDQRAAGFQRALNEKEAALRAAQERAREYEMSGMTQDERDALEWQQKEQEIERLRAENALLALQGEYPDELPVFRKILAGQSPKEQLDALRAYVASKAVLSTQDTPVAEPEPDIPPVDFNNPASVPTFSGTGQTFNGQAVTEDWANRVLDQFQGPART